VERKCSQLCQNFEVNKTVGRFARVNSRFKEMLAQLEAPEPVRDSRIRGRIFIEPGNRFLMHGSDVVVFGLPADNQRLGLDHDHEEVLNVQNDHSHLSLGKIRFSGPHL
jgi:hypothetical protein